MLSLAYGCAAHVLCLLPLPLPLTVWLGCCRRRMGRCSFVDGRVIATEWPNGTRLCLFSTRLDKPLTNHGACAA